MQKYNRSGITFEIGAAYVLFLEDKFIVEMIKRVGYDGCILMMEKGLRCMEEGLRCGHAICTMQQMF